jgi:hypothetical protein
MAGAALAGRPATALLGGQVTATYIRSPAQPVGLTKTAGGGLLSALAIACPVCNKPAVLLPGVSCALTVWAPLQPGPRPALGRAARLAATHPNAPAECLPARESWSDTAARRGLRTSGAPPQK